MSLPCLVDLRQMSYAKSFVVLWVSVKRTYHEAVEATNQSWCPEILIQPACGAGMEQVISKCCGSYVCEPVQEQTGQVLAKIWALKAWFYQPIIRQVTSKSSSRSVTVLRTSCLLLSLIEVEFDVYSLMIALKHASSTTVGVPFCGRCEAEWCRNTFAQIL